MTQFDDVPKDHNLLVLHREYTLWRQQLNGQIFRDATGPFAKACGVELDLFFDLQWTNGCAKNRDAGDLRRHRAHYDVTVMINDWDSSVDGLSPWLVEFSTGMAIVLTSFAWDILDTVGRGLKWDIRHSTAGKYNNENINVTQHLSQYGLFHKFYWFRLECSCYLKEYIDVSISVRYIDRSLIWHRFTAGLVSKIACVYLALAGFTKAIPCQQRRS